jgi:D-cysteine desulfhydrase
MIGSEEHDYSHGWTLLLAAMDTALPRATLAQLPTPIHQLPRLSGRLGLDLWIKRDDLTGSGLSGNKVRKLELLLGAAVAEGADTVVTCGGVQSNHCRSTAVGARRLGLEPVLLLKGERPAVPDGNILLDRLLGARIEYCTPDAYAASRDELLAELARRLRLEGRQPYVVPEGGSNALGALAYRMAGREALAQAGPFDRVVVAVGSGGTLAGLAASGIGLVSGVAVCDDAATFEAIVAAIAPGSLGPFEVVEGFQDARPWPAIELAATLEGMLLDPTYTGKAMAALIDRAQRGLWTGRTLFWHTGGVFGLFGRGDEVAW